MSAYQVKPLLARFLATLAMLLPILATSTISQSLQADELQPYPEYGFVRKEYQAKYFTVTLTSGNDYTFNVSRANVSLKPVNVNASPQQLGESFLEVFNPDGTVAVMRRQMQTALGSVECYFTDTDPGCVPYTLTAGATGEFKIRVDGYKNDFGGFALSVTNNNGQQLNVTPYEYVPDIQNITPQQLPGFDSNTSPPRIKNEDYLTRTDNVDVWSFTAEAGDFVQIQLEMIAPFPLSGGEERADAVAGKLFLFDPSFNLIVSDEGFVPFGNARILSSLPSTGTYYIAVTPLGEYDDDYCVVSCNDFWGNDRLHDRIIETDSEGKVVTDADGEPVIIQGPIIQDGIAHYELDTEIKILPYNSVAIANDKPKSVKVNAIIITNDAALGDYWTDRDGNDSRSLPSETEIKNYLATASSEFFELYSDAHWDGFELARISRFYSPEYVGTRRTDAILYDFSNLPVALEGHINIVFARLSDDVNVTGSTFLNGTLASKHGATLVVDAYQSPATVLVHELGHVLGIRHVAGSWPPAVMGLELSDQSVVGYTGLDHSNPEQSYMSTWIPIAKESGYDNKNRFLTEQSFTLNTPTYGRLFAKALRDWLERNEIIDNSAPSISSYQANLRKSTSISSSETVPSATSSSVWGDITAGPESGSTPYDNGIFPSLSLSALPGGTSAAAVIWEGSATGVNGNTQPSMSYKGPDGIWSATQTFDTASGVNVGAHQIAMDGDGNALALWEPASGKGIEVVSHNGTAWGSPETVSLSTTGNNYRADLAMNESGNAAAVWLSRIDDASWNLPPSVMFSQRPTGGSWSTADSLSDGDTAIEDPSVAINTSGDVLVTWQQLINGVFAVKGRYWDADTESWSSIETYSNTTENLHGGFAEAALDTNGNAVITWRQANAVEGTQLAPKGDIVARYRSNSSGTLGPITQLSAAGHDAFNRSVELDRKTVAFLADNSAVSTWYAFDGVDFRVYAAEMDTQGNWGTAAALSASGQHAKLPSLDVDGRSNGSVGVVWVRSNGVHKIVQFSSKSIDSDVWTSPTDLSSGTETAFWPVIAKDGLHTEALWSRFNGTNVSLSSISSAAEAGTNTIGGSVSGLASSESVLLQNNGGDNLTVNANGVFTFASPVGDGNQYAVTVLTPPTGKTCSISNGSGAATAAVTNVTVNCSVNAHSLGGSASGLSTNESMILQNNNGDDLTITANGAFTFATQVADGNQYAVTVLTPPTGKTCSISNDSGTATAAVTNVAVSCATSVVNEEPTKPVITRAEAEDSTIILYVSVSDTGNSALSFFTATCRSGSNSVTARSITSSVTLSGLDNTKPYICSVTASNEKGHISESSLDTVSITPEAVSRGLPIWLLYQATQ
ncbi:pre-peptidase C-terminal domain-containing protein [Luminiphilus sp.]|nr:pre-peptidase C-terminal domain-containing protein [Luminiphilus sp.]